VRVSSEQKPKASFAARALIAAWLGLLIVVAAAAGYVLVSAPPDPGDEREIAVAQPDNGAGDGRATPSPAAPAPKDPATASEPPAAPADSSAPTAPVAHTADGVPAEIPDEATEPALQATLPAEGESGSPSGAAPPPDDANAAWRRNSQAFPETDARPRIAVVLTGLGLSTSATEAAIAQLPAGITLSFTPYARRLDEGMAAARADGHEVMLDLPMEPTSYPNDDPGPQALLIALSARQNLERLAWTLARGEGYVGVAAVMGSRFAASAEDLAPVLEALKVRGLMYLDNRASDDSVASAEAARIALPLAVNDRRLDSAQASREAIDARLVQLETIAAAEGVAVAVGAPSALMIERLRDWSEGLEERGFALAPITAVANRQTRYLQAAERTLGE